MGHVNVLLLHFSKVLYWSLEWEPLQREERERYIDLALEQLSWEDGLVLTLCYITENTLPEITVITGWGLSATKVRLHQARKKLLEQLRTLLDEEAQDLL